VTIRPLLVFPDPGLKTVCTPVLTFDEDLRTLVDDLVDTMRAAPGVGITAAHIGVWRRVVVIELARGDDVRVYVNPQITWSSSETVQHLEGSVSMPGLTETIIRPQSISLRYQDLDGVPHEAVANGFLGICIQHEIDQLDGIFWLQRLSKLKRDRLVKKWQKSKA
jgi:peptide deformylase